MGKALTLIFIGAMLLYLGVFGISALPFRFQLTDYNSFTKVDPNNHITITSANSLTHIASRNELAYLSKQCSPFTDFTHSVEAMLTASGSSGINWIWAVSPNAVWQAPDVGGANTVGLMVYNGGSAVRLYGDVQPGYSAWTGGMAANVWYRFEITRSGLTVSCTIYKEATLVTTLTYTLPTAYTFSYVFGCGTSYYNTGAALQTMQIRNLQLSETGNLFVKGTADGAPVQFTAHYVGPSGTSPTVTVPTTGYTWTNIPTGSYTVYGTYGSLSANQQVSVTAGQTASANLVFAAATGSLSVKGTADGAAVSFTAHYVGPSGNSATVTVPTTGYTWTDIPTGSYTVYGTYNGIQKNKQVEVLAGLEVLAVLDFSTATGSLSVVGYADQVAVQFSAYYVGPSGQGPTVTVPTSGYTWSNLAPGTYTVYGTYNAIQKNQQVTVVAGQTVSATLTFSGTSPDGFDFLKWIEDMLNNSMVKTMFTLSGIGCIGIGAIGLVAGKPKEPSYYYG